MQSIVMVNMINCLHHELLCNAVEAALAPRTYQAALVAALIMFCTSAPC